VAADVFATTPARTNLAYSFWQDRFKASADFRGIQNWQFAGGFEQDNRKRSYQEVVETRESSVWGRASVQALENLGLSLKVAHADRRNPTYGSSVWLTEPDNPLLRKYNLAGRLRDSGTARIDWNLDDKLGVGVSASYAEDSYKTSAIGLQSAKSGNLALDVSYAFSERTQFQAYVQAEEIRSRQAGSESFAAPDWLARNKDRFQIVGFSVKHAAIADKLDIGGEFSASRTHADIVLDTVGGVPQFPNNTAATDRVKVYGTYKIDAAVSITASYVYEKSNTRDWQLDGVLPATVGNLLAAGQVAPSYRVDWLRLALRYRF
jgi:MtrB/PioB family decaheme-associated outer membrane protein